MAAPAAPIKECHQPKWPGAVRLRDARQKKGLSIRELAKAAGVHERLIRLYESGQRGPSARTLLALADVLDLSPDALYGTVKTQLAELAVELGQKQPKDAWSVSKVTTYLLCPAKFKFLYIDGVPEALPTSPEAALGTAVHAGVEAHNLARMGRQAPDPAKVVREKLDGELARVAPDPETGEMPDAGALAAEAAALYAAWEKEIAPAYTPVAVEQRGEITVAGVKFTVVLDTVTDTGEIRDLKTAKRRPSTGDLESNLQATAYAMAFREFYGSDAKSVTFDYLLRHKAGPSAESYSVIRTQKDFDRLARIVEGVTEAAAKGLYYPNPMSKFGCSTCPFKAQCEGEGAQ